MDQNQQPFVTDTAEEISTRDKIEQQQIRNQEFDSIVNTGIDCYVALRVDIIDEATDHNLFCGQVGKVENVYLSNEYKDYYLVTFIDYKKDQEEFAQCVVKKDKLLPLFCFSPKIYEDYKIPEQRQSIKDIRENWETFKFDLAPQFELARHKKVSTRFKIGRLVTVQVNFKQELPNGDEIIIEAGQIGIISQIKDTDFVEVTFQSIPFGELAVIRKKLFPSSLFSRSDNDFDPLNCVNDDDWKKTISIHKDFLFPLYVQNLDVNNL